MSRFTDIQWSDCSIDPYEYQHSHESFRYTIDTINYSIRLSFMRQKLQFLFHKRKFKFITATTGYTARNKASVASSFATRQWIKHPRNAIKTVSTLEQFRSVFRRSGIEKMGVPELVFRLYCLFWARFQESNSEALVLFIGTYLK